MYVSLLAFVLSPLLVLRAIADFHGNNKVFQVVSTSSQNFA